MGVPDGKQDGHLSLIGGMGVDEVFFRPAGACS